jgi:hypothetical protein
VAYWLRGGTCRPLTKRSVVNQRHRINFGGTMARLACALALGVSAAGLLACGGGAASSSPSADSGGNDDSGQVRLQSCLRKQGIDVPEPGQGGNNGPPANFDREKVQQALEGPCKQYQQAAGGNLSQQDQSELQDRLTKFTSCMRKNGVDIPDFTPGQGGAPPQQIDQNDPKVQKATEACRDQLPQGGPGGPGGPNQ